MSSDTMGTTGSTQTGGSVASRRSPNRSLPRRRLGGFLALERGWSITTVFFLVMVTVPWWASGSVPTLTDGMLVLLMCYGWNLVGGFLGEFSMAHMIFWGIGSYTTVLTINHDRALLPWVIGAVLVAVVCGAVMSGLIRLSGLTGALTLAILTTVFAEIAISVARGSNALGGAEGLIANSLPSWSAQTMFVMVVVLAAVAGLVNVAVANSRLGREWLAIRDDRTAAEVAGINVEARRMLAYALSALFFAAGGIYQAYYSGYATPDVSLGLSILFIAILAVFTGGHGTVLGPLVGWIIIYGLQVLASQMSNSPKVSLYAQLAEFGAALLILRLVLPRLHGDSVSGALLKLPRRLKQRFGAAPVTEATEHADLSHISAAQVLGLTDVDAESRHLTDGLKVAAVSKSFGPLHVLRDVHFEIRPGEVVGILGPNGAGKTTLCNLISGLEAPSSGLITLDGADVTHLPARKRSAAGFGRSFQAPRLFPSLTLMQNLMLGSRQIEETAADRALASMAIPHSSTRRGDDSQFFARRLTEVLKASLQAESLLILDEPLAGLTSEEHDIVLGMARQKAQDGACVLIVEHLIPVLAPAVDRIVVLHEGRIIADGKPATVLKDEAVVEAYLGSAHEMEETTHE